MTTAGGHWSNQLRGSFTRLRVFSIPQSAFTRDIARELGVGGVSTDPFTFGLPYFAVTNFNLTTDDRFCLRHGETIYSTLRMQSRSCKVGIRSSLPENGRTSRTTTCKRGSREDSSFLLEPLRGVRTPVCHRAIRLPILCSAFHGIRVSHSRSATAAAVFRRLVVNAPSNDSSIQTRFGLLRPSRSAMRGETLSPVLKMHCLTLRCRADFCSVSRRRLLFAERSSTFSTIQTFESPDRIPTLALFLAGYCLPGIPAGSSSQ